MGPHQSLNTANCLNGNILALSLAAERLDFFSADIVFSKHTRLNFSYCVIPMGVCSENVVPYRNMKSWKLHLLDETCTLLFEKYDFVETSAIFFQTLKDISDRIRFVRIVFKRKQNNSFFIPN